MEQTQSEYAASIFAHAAKRLHCIKLSTAIDATTCTRVANYHGAPLMGRSCITTVESA